MPDFRTPKRKKFNDPIHPLDALSRMVFTFLRNIIYYLFSLLLFTHAIFKTLQMFVSPAKFTFSWRQIFLKVLAFNFLWFHSLHVFFQGKF